MKILYDPIVLEHEIPFHAESPRRLDAFDNVPTVVAPDGSPYLELYHTRDYIEHVKSACERGEALDPDTRTGRGTWKAAIRSVGLSIMASDQGDFALIRPPGHHARPDHSGGFCIFNNIAIAVQRKVNEGRRVLLFDFDGHHGDGSSHYFAGSDRVLYWSLHEQGAYPNDDMEEGVGQGKGAGYSINVPLPAGSGDDIYLNALERFLPLAVDFRPDLVAVSAGFDSHREDLLLTLELTKHSYYRTGRILSENFSEIFAVLEGGYNPGTLRGCVDSFLAGINGDEYEMDERMSESRYLIFSEYEATAARIERKIREARQEDSH